MLHYLSAYRRTGLHKFPRLCSVGRRGYGRMKVDNGPGDNHNLSPLPVSGGEGWVFGWVRRIYA